MPKNELTYHVNHGGILRCCLARLDAMLEERAKHMREQGLGAPLSVEGEVYKTPCCNTTITVIDGVWRWNGGRDYGIE